MSRNGKILVAMSGGLDSTVTAVMLKEEGYDVVGVTMKTWDYANTVPGKETGCCSLDSINDARSIAVKHGIHHIILDIRDEFGSFVVDNFVDEYLAGRTPNPCVLCNTHIKWEALLKRADQLDCQYIATGHYANVRKEGDRHVVSKGLDESKDQSYVLWGLTQNSLSRTKFPLGKYEKSAIRQMALDWGYEEIARKSESYEICFVPNNDYREFLRFKEPHTSDLMGGDFVLGDGTVVGKHEGYPFYTVGQRRGLNLSLGDAYYVTDIDPVNNRVYIGTEAELHRTGMWVGGINMQKFSAIESMDAVTKVRYKDAGTHSVITQVGEYMEVKFNTPVRSIAPGQSAVFYDGEDVIGGGWIKSSFEV